MIPIILSSDWHLSQDNILEIHSIADQLIEVAIEINCKEHFILGDVFESRKAQPLDVLDTFTAVLDKFNKAGLTTYLIPGNHDKINYSSEKSYLDTYQYHPGVVLVSDIHGIIREGLQIDMIPFFENSIFNSKLKDSYDPLNEDTKVILLTHIGIEGFLRHDGEKEKDEVTTNQLSNYKEVFVGHYHNKSVKDNVRYIGSIMPKNFGEDNDKGFTILEISDGEFEVSTFKPNFKEYKKVEVDVESLSKLEISDLIKENNCENTNVRFIFKGEKTKLDSIDTTELQKAGIEVKKEAIEIEEQIIKASKDEVIEFNKSTILDEFKMFCSLNEIEQETGINYLEKAI